MNARRTVVAEYSSEQSTTPYQVWVFPTRKAARRFMAREKEAWQRGGYTVRGSVDDALLVHRPHNMVDAEAELVVFTDPLQIEEALAATAIVEERA